MTGRASHPALRRMLGPITVVCVGVGGAVGSGVFRTPGVVAAHVASPWWILSLWVFAGGITLMQSLVNAELATRFPKAGGEYEYLKRAYGPFAAFFFGWSCTVFIIGGGAATIAAALGDFAAELFRLDRHGAGPAFGCAAIFAVTLVNVLGLRTGALAQNLLTVVKVVALLGIGVGACLVAGRATPLPPAAPVEPAKGGWAMAFMLGLLPVFWSYTGATDSIRLAEEVKDVKRALPRALFGTVAVLTAVYCLYNYALLCALAPEQMAGEPSVAGLAFAGLRGWPVREAILLISIVICLGSITAVFLANVRVTYALARDGLAFPFLSKMSRGQAPVGSFILVGGIASCFVLNRSFEKIMKIYFLASAVLFGLTYLSLILFRLRDRRAGRPFPADAYRAPGGVVQAVLLIVLEGAIAARIILSDIHDRSADSLWTLAVLGGVALLYLIWRRAYPAANL